MSAYCRDLSVMVGLMSVRVRRVRLSVGTCSKMLGKCRYAFGELGFVPGLLRQSLVSVATCPASSV